MVLGAPLTHRIRQAQRQQSGRGAAQVPVQRGGDVGFVGVGVRPKQSDPTQLRHPPGLLVAVIGHLVIVRSGQQTQCVPQPDVFAGQIARRRRQVVGGHRGQAQVSPVLGRQRPPAVPIDFEPQDRCSQQAAVAQIIAHPRLDRAEILTHDNRTGPMRLQRDDADHCVVVITHIGALCGRYALRDPPQPEQADDVVDAHPAGVPEDR